MRNAILLTAICTVLVTAPTTAEATSPRQLAAQHTTRGDAARAGQRYAEAVSEYVLAYAYDPAPERLLNLARTYEAMGNRTVALELYRRTAQVARSGPAADDANRRIVALGGAAAGAGAIGAGGSVSVMTIPPGGEIWIDGQKKGNSPMAPVTVAAGQHRLEVRLNGYKTYAKTINVVSAGKINEMVSLQPGVSGPAPAPAAAAPMTLTVHSVPAGAQVLLNGRAVRYAGTSASARVLPGRYTLTVKKGGFRDFVQTLNVAQGQSPVVTVSMSAASGAIAGGGMPLPATPGSTTSVQGAWYGVMLDSPGGFSPFEKYTLTLNGSGSRYSGKLVVNRRIPLRGYRRKQCNNNDEAIWETSYQVSFAKTPGGGKIIGSGGVQTSCNCESMCRSDSEITIPVFVAPTNQLMVSDKIVFQRRRGSGAPGSATQPKITASSLTGNWTVRQGDVDTDTVSQLRLASRGGAITGRTSVRSTVQLGWRKRDCGNQAEITATFNFDASGEVDGDTFELSFAQASPPSPDCSCKPHVCEGAAQQVSVKGQKLRMTLDGNHLVGPGFLMTRK